MMIYAQIDWYDDEDVALTEIAQSKQRLVSESRENLKKLTRFTHGIFICDSDILLDAYLKPGRYFHCYHPMFKYYRGIITVWNDDEDFYYDRYDWWFIKPIFKGDFNPMVLSKEQLKTWSFTKPRYLCEYMRFITEYRILVYRGRMFAYSEYSIPDGYYKGPTEFGKIHIPFPYEYVRVLLTSRPELSYIIDIGYCPDKRDWVIVELNPPFSFSYYHIPPRVALDYYRLIFSDNKHLRETLDRLCGYISSDIRDKKAK